MSMSQVQSLLLYSLAINYVFLLLWFAAFTCAHEALYKLHSRWFKLTTSTFYGGLQNRHHTVQSDPAARPLAVERRLAQHSA
jgi:hypothetical protein